MCAGRIGGAAKKRAGHRGRDRVGQATGCVGKAALTTRGFSELVRLGRACGARSGDHVRPFGPRRPDPTAPAPQSRNFSLGIALGRGERPARGKLAEGEFTAPVLIELAASKKCRYAGINAVAAILSGATTIDEAIESLLTRAVQGGGIDHGVLAGEIGTSSWSWTSRSPKATRARPGPACAISPHGKTS